MSVARMPTFFTTFPTASGKIYQTEHLNSNLTERLSSTLLMRLGGGATSVHSVRCFLKKEVSGHDRTPCKIEMSGSVVFVHNDGEYKYVCSDGRCLQDVPTPGLSFNNLSLQSDVFNIKDGNTLLMEALLASREDVVRMLVEEFGADVNATNCDKETALHCLLYLCFSNVNHSPSGRSMLVETLPLNSSYFMKMIELLISHGANVDIEDDSGNTPLTIALDKISQNLNRFNIDLCLDILHLLYQNPKSENCEISRIKPSYEQISRISDRTAQLSRMIHPAVRKCRLSLVKMLVKSGACPTINVNIPKRKVLYKHFSHRTLFNEAVTPLFTAFLVRDPEQIQFLLDINFIHSFDLNPPPHLLQQLRGYLHDQADATVRPQRSRQDLEHSRQSLQLLESFYSSPPSLWTLSFVSVSTMAADDAHRDNRISQSGLPPSLKEKLTFGQNSTCHL